MPQSKRVAIYARVSTDDKHQDPETQLRQLREYAKLRNLTITEEYIDYASGRTNQRPHFKRLLDDVRKRRADVVLRRSQCTPRRSHTIAHSEVRVSGRTAGIYLSGVGK